MIDVRKRFSWVLCLPLAIVLATSGCASKKYVNQRYNQVNQKLAQLEKQTNDHISWLNRKEEGDIAQLNNRVGATEQRLTELANAVQETQGAANRAMEEAGAARSSRDTTVNIEPNVTTRPPNYEMIGKADVMFGFNKANLTSAGMAALDDVASKFQSTPNAIVELAGFTDKVGSANYNLDLSRRRAWAVQRYLVDHRVPLRSISVVGLGKGAPPAGLEPETTSPTGKDGRDPAARRVNIRVFDAGTSTTGTSQQ